jgi:hypothetical protein
MAQMDAYNMNPIVKVYIWAACANICWHGTDGCRQYEPLGWVFVGVGSVNIYTSCTCSNTILLLLPFPFPALSVDSHKK